MWLGAAARDQSETQSKEKDARWRGIREERRGQELRAQGWRSRWEAGLSSRSLGLERTKSERQPAEALHKPTRAFHLLPNELVRTPSGPIGVAAEVILPDSRGLLVGCEGLGTCRLFALPEKTGSAARIDGKCVQSGRPGGKNSPMGLRTIR